MKLEDVSISLEDIRKEVLTMKLCDHENVLACHCCFNVGSTLWIVTPMMIKGSFLRILQYMKEVQMVKEEDGLSVSWLMEGITYVGTNCGLCNWGDGKGIEIFA